MDEHIHLEALWQAAMTNDRQLLLDMIGSLFHDAIDARSPKRRPPGKAGLRAEKGYFRLLYLEGVFQEKVTPRKTMGEVPEPLSWQQMMEILNQLKDIPELRLEILTEIESNLKRINPAMN